MAQFIKYNIFAEHLCDKIHDLMGTTDTIKVALTNTAPNIATHTVLADIGELSTGGGYTAGGIDTQNEGVRTGGVVYVSVVDTTWTNTGTLGPFRWGVYYNSTAAGGPLIGYVDHGAAVTLTIVGQP